MSRNIFFVSFLLSALTLCAQTVAPQGTVIKPTDPNIQYIGRIEDSNSERPVFTFPGVQIRTGFTGTSLQMMAKPYSGYFMAQIDEGEAFKVSFFNTSDSIVTLATALPQGIHQAKVMYVGEGYERLPEFRGFIVDQGQALAPAPALPDRRIEFIGNSITCGYGVEATDANAPYLEATANHYHTYAAITARRLDAQHLVVARSGIGVYRNYNGLRTGDAVNMNTEYPHTLLYNKEYLWDFSRYTPQVVCINLGTNDTSTTGADPKLLLKGYQDLYRQVRSHYPDAKIVFLCGCMMRGETDLPTAQKAMDTVVAKAHQQGDSEVYRFDFTPQTGDLGYGASWHPSIRQHQKMADELTPYLRELMQW
ncbi:MAG: lipase [Bacteroidaceae bacterium]|nr:lipase [Bacteroidaceae bacterium]